MRFDSAGSRKQLPFAPGASACALGCQDGHGLPTEDVRCEFCRTEHRDADTNFVRERSQRILYELTYQKTRMFGIRRKRFGVASSSLLRGRFLRRHLHAWTELPGSLQGLRSCDKTLRLETRTGTIISALEVRDTIMGARD